MVDVVGGAPMLSVPKSANDDFHMKTVGGTPMFQLSKSSGCRSQGKFRRRNSYAWQVKTGKWRFRCEIHRRNSYAGSIRIVTLVCFEIADAFFKAQKHSKRYMKTLTIDEMPFSRLRSTQSGTWKLWQLMKCLFYASEAPEKGREGINNRWFLFFEARKHWKRYVKELTIENFSFSSLRRVQKGKWNI